MADAQLIEALRNVVGAASVLDDAAEMLTYECDGFPIAKSLPRAVVFPASTAQVAQCIHLIARAGVQIIARGSGTGLTGGCVAYDNGVIVSTTRMKRIVEVDLDSRIACVEAGVRNTELTDHVNAMSGGENLYFAPDPSSQKAATIGGNAATNAGGLHTLKYGVTTTHVLGLEVVLGDGRVVNTRGSMLADGVGPDLPALFCGSEGTLGLITKVWVRLTPKPQAFRTVVAIYEDPIDACGTVRDVIGAGIVPAAMEMMDGAMVRVVEETFHYGFPTDAGALLLIELDGDESQLAEPTAEVVRICRENHARDVNESADPQKRNELWSARKSAFGAIGKISPSYCTQDACVPRSKLPEVLDRIMAIGDKHGLQITNVFHAGDGNVHPILLFDEHDPEDVRRVLEASHEILEFCISVGGALTGEHGVGVEKLPLMEKMFRPPAMEAFDKLKTALDPHRVLNEGKVLPSKKVHVDLLKPTAVNTPGGAL